MSEIRCAHCGSAGSFHGWGFVETDGQRWAFCHSGCLIHWLYTMEPDSFEHIVTEELLIGAEK